MCFEILAGEIEKRRGNSFALVFLFNNEAKNASCGFARWRKLNKIVGLVGSYPTNDFVAFEGEVAVHLTALDAVAGALAVEVLGLVFRVRVEVKLAVAARPLWVCLERWAFHERKKVV